MLVEMLPAGRISDMELHPRTLKFYTMFLKPLRPNLNRKKGTQRERLTRAYLMPIINRLFEKNYVNYAQLLLLVIEEYFLSKETEAEFEEVLGLFSAQAVAAGLRFREAYPLPPASAGPDVTIGFVGHSVAISGYEVIIGLGKHLAPFRPRMYAMRIFDVAHGPTTAESFEGGGIEFVMTRKAGYDVFALRRLLVQRPVDIAIWPMPPFHMFFFFGFGLAHKQIFLSQYLRPHLQFKHLDGAMTLGGAGALRRKVFNNHEWAIVPQVASLDVVSSGPNRKYLFTPARIEKLKQPEFLNCVARILERDESTFFKWTGYHRDDEVVAFFRKRGLAHRHLYVPWMNSHALTREIQNSYALLACFPLSLGTVEYIAAHNEVPIVSLYDEQFNLYWRDAYWEAINGNRDLQEICLNPDGTSKILIARTPTEYIEVALRIVNEPELAMQYAGIYKRAYDYTYHSNPNDITAIFRDFIDDVRNSGAGANT